MIHYRHSFPEERAAVIATANRVFSGAGADIDFETAIPKVYGAERETSDLQYIAVDENRKIHALIAMLPNRIHVGPDILKCGYIGTVSVIPESRGQGHMKELMRLWEQEMRGAGTDLAILDGQRQRYQYFGYVPGAPQYTFTISQRGVKHALKGLNIRGASYCAMEAGTEEETWAKALQESLPYRMERPSFVCWCRSYRYQPWAFLKDGRFAGYAVSDADRRHIAELHPEKTEDLDLMLKAWMEETRLKETELTVPAWDDAAVRRLADWAEDMAFSPAAKLRIFNWKHVTEVMLKLKSSFQPLDDGEAGFSVEGQTFTVRVRNNRVTVTDGADQPLRLDALEAGKLFLAPFPVGSGIPGSWFPLPFSVQKPDEF